MCNSQKEREEAALHQMNVSTWSHVNLYSHRYQVRSIPRVQCAACVLGRSRLCAVRTPPHTMIDKIQNPFFSGSRRILMPCTSLLRMQLWTDFYLRLSPSLMHGPTQTLEEVRCCCFAHVNGLLCRVAASNMPGSATTSC